MSGRSSSMTVSILVVDDESDVADLFRQTLWASVWRPALQESEVADAPTLEPMMLNDASRPAQAAILTRVHASNRSDCEVRLTTTRRGLETGTFLSAGEALK